MVAARRTIIFPERPLEAAKVKSGIRANLPIEIVFDTAEVLQAGCEVFVTESEGFLTAEPVPGHTILFINDDSKDLTLWSQIRRRCCGKRRRRSTCSRE